MYTEANRFLYEHWTFIFSVRGFIVFDAHSVEYDEWFGERVNTQNMALITFNLI